jgi:hypothetical protein
VENLPFPAIRVGTEITSLKSVPSTISQEEHQKRNELLRSNDVPIRMLIRIKEKIMTIGQDRRGIGVFSTKQDAEFALNALRDSGFPMDKVSMIAKDDGDESTRGTDLNKKPGHEVVKGAEVGAFTGTVLGLLAGLVVVFPP